MSNKKTFFYLTQHLLFNEGSSVKLKHFFLFKNFCLKNDLTLINIQKTDKLSNIFLKKRLK